MTTLNKKTRGALIALAVAGAGLMGSGAVQAAVIHTLTGTSGNWSTTTWTNGAPTSSSAGDTATYAGSGTASIALNTGVTIGQITDTSSGTWNITGTSNTLTLNNSGSNAVLSTSSSGSITIAPNISFVTGLNITTSSSGSLTVTGSITGTGNIALSQTTSAGALTLGAINNNGTITSTNADSTTVTINGIIGSSVLGVVENAGGSHTGKLLLSGANTYTSATTVQAGTILAGVDTVGGASPTSGAFGVNSAVKVYSGATLDLNGHNETIGSLSDNAGSGGTVTSGASGAITLITGGDNTNTSFAGVIQNGSGTLSVTKIGTGAWTLSGTNTFGGAGSNFTLSSGTLNINSAAALGNASNTFIINGGIIDNTSAAAKTTSNYAQTWGGDFEFIGTKDLNLGTGNVTLSASRTVTVDAGNLTIGGVISGSSFSLTKNGAGTLNLPNISTYGGGTIINLGTIAINRAGGTATPLGTGNLQIVNGTLSLAVNSNSDTTWTTASAAAGSQFTYSGGATVSLSRNSPKFLAFVVGNTTPTANLQVISRVNQGTLVIAPSTGTAGLSTSERFKVNTTTAGNLPPVTNGIVNTSIIGQNSDANDSGDFLNYTSASGFQLYVYTSGDQNFASPTSIKVENVTSVATNLASKSVFALRANANIGMANGATLTVGNPGTGANQSNQAGVILNGTTISASSGSATLAFGSAEGTIYTSLANGTISTVVSGTGGITTFGPGVLTLSNASNSYSGQTTINDGTLKLSAGNTNNIASSSLVAVQAGATLDVSTLSTQKFALASGQTFTALGVGTATVTGTGGVAVGAQTVDLRDGTFTTLQVAQISSSSGAHFYFDLNGTDSNVGDLINVTASGGITFASGMNIGFDANPTTNGLYRLFQYTGAAPTLTGITLPSVSGHDLSLTTESSAGSNYVDLLVGNGNNSTLYFGGSPASDGSSTSSPSAVNVGRIMKSVTVLTTSVALNKNGTDGTTYDVTASGTGVSSTSAGTGITYTGTPNINATLDISAVGNRSGTIIVTNKATSSLGTGQGSADANDVINLSATVVDNRPITIGSATFNRIMVGSTKAVTLTGSGLDTSYTMPNVVALGSAYSPETGVTVNGVTGIFSGTGASASQTVNLNFTTTGTKGATVNLGTQGIVTKEGLTGETLNNGTALNLTYSATVVDNRPITIGSATFNRIMVGSTKAVTLTGSGADTNFTKPNVVALGSALTPETGVSVNGVAGIFSGTGASASQTVNVNFSATGTKGATVNLGTQGIVTKEGLTNETLNNGTALNLTYSATVVDNRPITIGSATFNRIMVGSTKAVTLTGSGADTNFTKPNVVALGSALTPETGVSVNGVAGTFSGTGASASQIVNVSFSGTGVKGSTVHLGTSGIVTTEGLTGETLNAGNPLDLTYSATVVDNRSLSATNVDLGNVFVSGTTGSQNTTISSSAIDNVATRVTLGSTNKTASVTDGTITLSGTGSDLAYPTPTAAPANVTRGITGVFSASGSQSGNATYTPTGEGLTGEVVNTFTVHYTANVFQHASLTTSTSGGNLNLTNTASNDNGAGSQSAGVTINSLAVGDTTHFNAPTLGVSHAVGNGDTSGVIATVGSYSLKSNVLNNDSHTYNTTITSTAQYTDSALNNQASVSGPIWSISATQSNVSTGIDRSGNDTFTVAGQSADVINGDSYADYYSKVDAAAASGSLKQVVGTTATIRAGTNNSGSTQNLTMKFRARQDGEIYPGTTPPFSGSPAGLYSDVVNVSGVAGIYVLQMTYDPAVVPSSVQQGGLVLGWLNNGIWENAVLGNDYSAGGAVTNEGTTNWLTAIGGSLDSSDLGKFGVDTVDHTVWAVLNHNSEFAVIPEPASLGLLGLGAIGLLSRRRKR